MASRRSHAPTNDQQIEHELRVPQSGTYIMKPTASCEAAQLWVSDSNVSPRDTALIGVLLQEDMGLHLLWVAAGLRRDAVASYG